MVPMAAPPMIMSSLGCTSTSSFPFSIRKPPIIEPKTTRIPMIANIWAKVSDRPRRVNLEAVPFWDPSRSHYGNETPAAGEHSGRRREKPKCILADRQFVVFMEASIVDLRYRMKAVLEALDRGESV